MHALAYCCRKLYGCCYKTSKCCGTFVGVLMLVVLLVGTVGLAVVVIACLPLLITAVVILLMFVYFAVRFIEFVSGDDSYTEVFSEFGDIVASLILFTATVNMLFGWEIWLTVMYKVHGLRHHVILGLEAVKWIQLNSIFTALCLLTMCPRAILVAVRQEKDIKTDVVHFIDGVVGAMECVFFIAAEAAVMKFVPSWKHHVSLGFETWKFIQLLVLILLGIMFINITSRVIVFVIEHFLGDRKHVVYYTKGLRTNANFVFISTLIFLVVWTKLVNPRFKRAGVGSDRRLEMVTWAFVCLSISSALWLVKKCIVLSWTADAVYNRFNGKIIDAAKQFYFLVEIGHAAALDSTREGESNTTRSSVPMSDTMHKVGRMVLIGRSKTINLGEHSVKNNQMPNVKGPPGLKQQTTTLPTYQLQQLTQKFHNIEDKLKEGDTTIATKFATHYNMSEISTPDDLQSFVKDIYAKSDLKREVAEILYDQIKEVDERQVVDVHKFEKWVIKACKNCWELSNTIAGAKEVASYLNKLLTWIFLPLVILIWLLMTKIATAKLLILLSTPILTATFIFGDTCKNIFQGIVFAFVMHIFDVGDICVIDDTRMEVKRIGVWRTIFVNVETNEKIMYQNSILAEKLVSKHKGGLDLNDCVDYFVPIRAWTLTTFDDLTEQIDKYIEDNGGRYQRHVLGVLVKEVGDESVKITIHFKHKTGDQDMFYSDCIKKHNKSRANLLMKAKEILNDDDDTG